MRRWSPRHKLNSILNMNKDTAIGLVSRVYDMAWYALGQEFERNLEFNEYARAVNIYIVIKNRSEDYVEWNMNKSYKYACRRILDNIDDWIRDYRKTSKSHFQFKSVSTETVKLILDGFANYIKKFRLIKYWIWASEEYSKYKEDTQFEKLRQELPSWYDVADKLALQAMNNENLKEKNIA